MNIKIVICFIIIVFIYSASPGAADKVWSAKSSGLIDSNDSLAFENYLVKAKIQNKTYSSLTIYKNMIQIEKKDFTLNEFKIYDSVGVTLLGVEGNYSWVLFSKLEENILWVPSGRATLKWGDTYSFENYSIGFESLGKDSVTLAVTGKNASGSEVLKKNDSKIYDNMRLVVTDINLTGIIELELFKYDIPNIEAQIITNKDNFDPDDVISVSVNIMSEKKINIARITLSGTKPVVFKPHEFTVIGINGKTLTSQIEKLPAGSTLVINAKIEVRDYKNNAYFATISKEVSVRPYISIQKRIQEETDEEIVQVELVVFNSGFNTTLVHISDNVSEINPKQMEWDLEVGPKKTSNVSYTINPQKPGTYQLPAATASWNGKMSLSNKAKTTVHMPYIRMVKTAVNKQGLTDVELEIVNDGDRLANVAVKDNVPKDFPLAKGNTSWSGFLDAGKKETLKYTLTGNALSIPAADATYRDIHGIVRKSQSNKIELKKNVDPIRVTNPEKDYTKSLNAGWYEMILFMILSFIAISGIIGSVAFTAFMIIKNKMRV